MLPNLTKDQLECLEFHNTFRENHSCKPIEWNEELSQKAQKRAEYLASIDKMEHEKNIDEGENLVFIKGSSLSGKMATQTWYNEYSKYNFESPGFNPQTGHFTQLIWKDSRYFGYGSAKSKSGKIYAVARYLPSGNFDGEFDSNVLPTTTPNLRSNNNQTSLNDDEFTTLRIHNDLRSNHTSDPLIWSTQLALIAKNQADLYYQNEDIDTKYSIHNLGENSCQLNINTLGETIVENWYDEIKNYNFSEPGYSEDTKNFTQIVWKNSKEFGFSKKTCDISQKTYFVMIYSPKGNIEGEYKQNVLEPNVEVKPSIDLKSFQMSDTQAIALKIHNELRDLHLCLPLKWSEKLQKEAEEWLSVIIKDGNIRKSNENKSGENIGYEWGNEECPERIIKSWYNEEKYYDYSNPKFSPGCLSMTQIIWASTEFLGFTYIKTEENIVVYVARYWPPGNIPGLFEANIFKSSICSKPSYNIIEDYMKWILKYHNIYRKKHRSEKLSLSKTLCNRAMNLANEILEMIIISQNIGYGNFSAKKFNYVLTEEENLPNPKIVCKLWYNTSCYFEYDKEDINLKSTPFLEIVWRSTKEIGVGVCRIKNTSMIVVIYDRNDQSTESVIKNVKRCDVEFAAIE